ncbi:DUF4837 family protein [candidate division KSB1 bacterium]|nr:DUF4837 family protein [candidate division KSB1 bacterium]
MSIFKYLKYSLFLLFSLVMFSCHMKKSPIGSSNKIIVLADTVLWKQVGGDVMKMIEQEKHTPQPEKIFSAAHHSPRSLGDLTRYHNIILIGTLEEDDDAKYLLDRMLNETSRQAVLNDKNFTFQVNNAWARQQLLTVLVAKDTKTLQRIIPERVPLLFQIYDDFVQSTISSSVFNKYRQKDLEKQLLQHHGWSIKIQHDYVVAVDSAEARFVWLRRMPPQREIFVYYEPVEDPSVLSKEWMMRKRDSLTAIYYSGDKIRMENATDYPDPITVEEATVEIYNSYTIRLDGVWENRTKNIGGPFRSYGFYNKKDGRIYLIDLSIFAPGQKKWPYMRQLIAHAYSFYSEDRE